MVAREIVLDLVVRVFEKHLQTEFGVASVVLRNSSPTCENRKSALQIAINFAGSRWRELKSRSGRTEQLRCETTKIYQYIFLLKFYPHTVYFVCWLRCKQKIIACWINVSINIQGIPVNIGPIGKGVTQRLLYFYYFRFILRIKSSYQPEETKTTELARDY